MGDNMITNRKYLVYVIVFVLLLIVLTAAGTYAYFKIQITSQSGTVVGLAFDCMDISYSEENTINLEGQYPISDEYALENLTPLTITVTNNCTYNEEPINYMLTLTSLSNNVGYIPDNKMRMAVIKRYQDSYNHWNRTLKYANYITSLTKYDSGFVYTQVNNSLNNREDTQDYSNRNVYRLDFDAIGYQETIYYDIYVWLDYYEGDTTHTGLNDNTTEGLDFVAATNIITNVVVSNPEYNIVQNNNNYTVSVLDIIGGSFTDTTPTVKSTAREGAMVIIDPAVYNDLYEVTSFQLDGVSIGGNYFTMPNRNVTVSNIVYEQTHYRINNSNNSVDVDTIAKHSTTVILAPVDSDNYRIDSFDLDGVTIYGHKFVMPEHDVTITNVVISPIVVVETSHNPFPIDGGTTTYYENTFEHATSITVDVHYELTCCSNYSDGNYVELFRSSNTVQQRLGGICNYNKDATVTISGNYVKINWYYQGYSDYSCRNRYGFKAIVTPNYD